MAIASFTSLPKGRDMNRRSTSRTRWSAAGLPAVFPITRSLSSNPRKILPRPGSALDQVRRRLRTCMDRGGHYILQSRRGHLHTAELFRSGRVCRAPLRSGHYWCNFSFFSHVPTSGSRFPRARCLFRISIRRKCRPCVYQCHHLEILAPPGESLRTGSVESVA